MTPVLTWDHGLNAGPGLPLNTVQKLEELILVSADFLPAVQHGVHFALQGSMLAHVAVTSFPHISPPYIPAAGAPDVSCIAVRLRHAMCRRMKWMRHHLKSVKVLMPFLKISLRTVVVN